MTTKTLLSPLVGLVLLGSLATAQQPQAVILPPIETKEPGAKDQPKDKNKDKNKKTPDKNLTEPPKADEFQFPATAVGEFRSFFTPSMMGDKQGTFALRTVVVTGSQTTVVTTPNNVLAPTVATTTVGQARNVIVPVPNRGAFNIAENESPIPRDRVFVFWNSYPSLGFPQTGLNAPLVTTTTTTTPAMLVGRIAVPATTTTVTTVLPGAPRVDLNREVFGFEKTFLNGYASIELRAPLVQQQDGGVGIGANDVGDLTIIGKYALLFDRNTGDILSVGLAVTVPTGPSVATTGGNIQDVLLQPFVGYIWNIDRFYLQGFHSIVVPTDARDVTLLFNDVGVGYWLYRGDPSRVLSFVVPSVEAHVSTPLNHRDLNGPIIVPDAVVLTTGVHFGLFRNATLTVGAGVPITGPHPYNVEAMVQLNWRF